jgi:uncharacterized RDD family membrane protein YckC
MPPPPPAYAPAPQWQAPPAPSAAPEAGVEFRYAGFWIRVVAYVIDSILINVVALVIGFIFAFIAVIVNPNVVEDSQSTTFNVADQVVGVLISFAYFAGLWTLNGCTYGQRWLGLRVVDAATFQPPRPAQAALRWLGLVLSFLALCIGVIWVAFDPRKQGWMDKLAGTVVIRRA